MLNNVKTLIYIITGEYAGIQEICEAFETEEEQHKAFEEKTGFTWEQYLDGEYNFDSIESTDYFYRCFEVELQGAKTKGEQVTLLVDIECYDRSMTVVVSRLQADQAAAIMGEHYNTWIEGTAEDVGDSCCEEYILEGLKVAGIQHTYKFVKDKEQRGDKH